MYRIARLICCMLGVILVLLASPRAFAQETPGDVSLAAPGIRLSLGGALQARTSYNCTTHGDAPMRTSFGVGLRRARVRLAAFIGPRAQVFMQVDGAAGTLTMLDLWAAYQLAPSLRLRVGRFASTQPRAFIPTGLPFIDGLARATIAEQWGAATVGTDGRDFGLEARWQRDGLTALLLLHNGDGGWAEARGNVRADISRLSGFDHPDAGLAAATAITYQPAARPALEVGGTLGLSTAKNDRTVLSRSGSRRNYVTYSGHVYWGARPGSQPLRAKLDVIGLLYQPVEFGGRTMEQHWFGAALLSAVRPVAGTEIFARGEYLDANTTSNTDASVRVFTGGLTVSPSALRGEAFHRERITLAYAGRYDRPLPASGQPVVEPRPKRLHHQLAVQLQLVFF